MTTFAGSAQFAAASILGVGGTVAAAITAAVLLNARYGPIGVSVAPWLTGSCLVAVPARTAHGRRDAGPSPPRETAASTLRCCSGAGVTLYAAWVGGHGARGGVRRRDRRPVDVGARRGVPGALPRAARRPSSRDGRAVRARRCSGGGASRLVAHAVHAGRRPDHRRERRPACWACSTGPRPAPTRAG